MFKHIEQITYEGDNDCYGYDAGYCKDIDGYVFRMMSGFVYDYCRYYRISKEEYELVKLNMEKLNSNELYPETLIPDIRSRLIGAEYKRSYEVVLKPEGFDPYLFNNAPYLLEDGVFYFHLFFEGKHYAAAPLCWKGRVEDENGISRHIGPYLDREDLDYIFVNVNGEKKYLCFGKEVETFEGMDEFEKLLQLSRDMKKSREQKK